MDFKRTPRPARGWWLVIGVLVGASICASAQQLTFKGGTRLVSVFATVVDAQRRLAPSLTEQDFEIFDNDKPQPLVFFKSEVQPITVIVMLDTSFSMTRSIPLLRSAAEQFLIRLLPEDKGRVGAFNDKIEMSSHFTNNRDELVTDVKDLDYGNGTRLWDAVSASIDELERVDPFAAPEIEAALRRLAERLELSPRKAFEPIRIAVTGSKVSPGLFESIELLGKDETLKRLDTAAALTSH